MFQTTHYCEVIKVNSQSIRKSVVIFEKVVGVLQFKKTFRVLPVYFWRFTLISEYNYLQVARQARPSKSTWSSGEPSLQIKPLLLTGPRLLPTLPIFFWLVTCCFVPYQESKQGMIQEEYIFTGDNMTFCRIKVCEVNRDFANLWKRKMIQWNIKMFTACQWFFSYTEKFK